MLAGMDASMLATSVEPHLVFEVLIAMQQHTIVSDKQQQQ
jgi:hypothetical protein